MVTGVTLRRGKEEFEEEELERKVCHGGGRIAQ